MTKTALISGATGQDGACLGELRLDASCTVHGIKRQAGLIGDLTDATHLIRIVQETQPGVICTLGMEKRPCLYQVSTSELFGNGLESPRNENTPFAPRSPHAAARLNANWITCNYREAHGIQTPGGTGAMPGITCGPCGLCSSRTSRATK